jgi:uncharacterized protein
MLTGGLGGVFFLREGKPNMTSDKLDRAGRSQLHYAVRDGNVHEVARLIRTGSDVNSRDKNGRTPLHAAAQEHAAEVTKMLLDAGAEIDAQDENGNPPLSTAIFYYRGNGDVIQLLRKRGANAFLKNNNGVNPVEFARAIANYDVAKFFDDVPK